METAPIPLGWTGEETQKNNLETDQTLNDQQEHQKEEKQQQENLETKGDTGKVLKRGNSEGQKKETKRVRVQQRDLEADHSCSDDDETADMLVLDEDGNELAAIKKTNGKNNSPGVPMAQSTPMVQPKPIASSTSSRSAFSMLQPSTGHSQPQASLGPNQYMAPNGHHFPTPIGYYFPPPQAGADQQMFQPAVYPFMNWAPRAPTPSSMGMGMSMSYPAGGLMMPAPMPWPKLEPLEPAGNDGGIGMMQHSLLNLDAGNSGKRKYVKGGQRKKTTTVVRKSKQDSGIARNDSSLGNNSSILSTTVGGDTADDTYGTGDSMNITNNSNSIIVRPNNPTFGLHPISGFETYCTVPGRLTLLSNLKKYRVSIAEIQRRLSPPECLNASILGGILRKAKNKDGGRLLREQLMTYGVELTSGRRKQGPLTCFSSLVEEEAAQLAYDFNCINRKHYPHKEAAAYAMAEVQNAKDASLLRMELYYASKFLERISSFHHGDRSPLADQPKLEEGIAAELSPDLQEGLTHYSMLTHGFGGRVVKSMAETFQCVINECYSLLNRNFEQTAGTSSQMDDHRQSAPTPMPVLQNFKY